MTSRRWSEQRIVRMIEQGYGRGTGFTAAQWDPTVIDIREQYPLPGDVTLVIARRLRIKHPVYPGTRVPRVLAVDFLLTKPVGSKTVDQAIDINPLVDPAPLALRRARAIACEYFKAANIEYKRVSSPKFRSDHDDQGLTA